jgi:PST family polysaccharide transporter
MLTMAFVNVSGALGLLALVQIGASLAALAAAWPLAVLAAGGSQLAYVGMILVPLAVQFGLAAFMSWRLGWLPLVGAAFRQRPARADVMHFLTYFAAHLGGGLVSSASMLALRAAIIETQGQTANGLFQASWTLTQHNLTLLMASFGTYLLPTLSATHDPGDRRRFLDETLPLIIVLTVPLAGLGLLFMPLILRVLYSADFLPAIALLRWMLLANLFSACVAVFVILLLARGRPMISAATEIGWYAGFAGCSVAVLAGVIDVGWMGLQPLEAVGAAFFALHGLRLACLVAFCRKTMDYAPAPAVWRTGAIGFGLLLLAGIAGWSAHAVNWAVSLPLGLLLCLTPLLLLNRSRLVRLRTLLRTRFGG